MKVEKGRFDSVLKSLLRARPMTRQGIGTSRQTKRGKVIQPQKPSR